MLRKIKNQRRNVKCKFYEFLMLTFVVGLCGCHGQKAAHISIESESDILLEAESFFNESTNESTDHDTHIQELIYVHVCGCVNAPGVYVLEEDTRVVDAVEAAGGMTIEADTTAVNLAVILEDEMRIYIPSLEETKDGDAVGSDYSVNKKVNINTATAEQLTQLSGIGALRAADIIEYRNTYGKFDSVEDLMKVSGIKEGVFEKIKDQITVN